MDEARWQRVKELFATALDREGPARAAYLDEVCGADAELRAELDSLIAAHDSTEDFIEKPAAHVALGLTGELEPRSWIGRRAGDYRLVAEVGRGGMSEVYKAVRDDDEYHKEVAVKVLRQGFDTKSLLRRFKVEIQILATLDHPHIARLLDAGSTEDGLPYLVMDYIEGRPIDEYCTSENLSVKERLELFRALCGAVQYVHQHLMVHGDLKCTNVLVSAQGSVKLLDFGIARLLAPTSASTVPGVVKPETKLTTHIALTPEYASPEQVRGGPITTASDVYSLGVVLYQLLTGVLPYRFRGEFSYELATRILQQEPKPPSVACEVQGFARQLRGDLDNIVLMALEKDPEKRYHSVEALDADIGRHLEGFPVTAHAASYPYRLQKFAGRHKAGLSAIALLLITLVGGVVSTNWQTRVAVAERERAQRHFDEVRKLANIFMFDLHTAIEDLPGATPARQMLVENSLKYLAALSAESANEPSLQRELASAYEKVADVQGGFQTSNLGDTAGAIASYRTALDIRKRLNETDAANRDLRRDLLRNYGKLSEMLSGDGDSQGALLATRQALKLAQELASAPDATILDRRNMGSALSSLGWQLTNAGQFGDGVILLRQSVAIYESLLDLAPRDTDILRMLGVSYERIGGALLQNTQQHAESLEMYRKAYETGRRMTTGGAQNTRVNKMIGYALLGMGGALNQMQRPREALQKQLEGAQILHEVYDVDPRNEMGRYDAAFALSAASVTDLTLGDLDAATRRLTDALAILSGSSGVTQSKLNETKVLLALTHFRLGRVEARRASTLSAPAQRSRTCEAAHHWFELSRPVLLEMEAAQWPTAELVRAAQIPGELTACAGPLRAAKRAT